MSWTQTLHTAWSAVRSHAMRSTLTVLGILIGIAAVILTVGLGLGSQQDVSAQINSLGSNLLIVTPGSTTSVAGLRAGFGSGSTLKRSDADALASTVNAPDIGAVAAEKSTSLSLVNGDTNWTTTVTGTTASWLDVRSRSLTAGTFLSAQDDADRALVVVLGSDTATQLFGTTNVVGQVVTISHLQFTVIGVLASAGASSGASLDDMAIVPLSTAAENLVGGSSRNAVSKIYLQAASTAQLSAANQEAQALLLNLHSITSSGSADFTIASQESLVSTATWAIRRQFLLEASILGLVGGLVGAVLGVVAARTLPTVLDSTIVVSGAAVAGSVVVAVGIGLVFGVYPATRAARLAPIDALRSE